MKRRRKPKIARCPYCKATYDESFVESDVCNGCSRELFLLRCRDRLLSRFRNHARVHERKFDEFMPTPSGENSVRALEDALAEDAP